MYRWRKEKVFDLKRNLDQEDEFANVSFFFCVDVCSALCLPLQVSPVQKTAVALALSPRNTARPAVTSHMATAPSTPRHPMPARATPPLLQTGRRPPAHSPATSSSIGRRAKASASSSSARLTGLRRPPPTVSPVMVLVVIYGASCMLMHHQSSSTLQNKCFSLCGSSYTHMNYQVNSI